MRRIVKCYIIGIILAALWGWCEADMLANAEEKIEVPEAVRVLMQMGKLPIDSI